MDLITIDMETYYDKSYSLSRLTTEEYIRDDKFEVIGVSVKVNDGPSVWYSGDHEVLGKHLKEYNWRNSTLLAHNTLFDGAILDWIFKIKPRFFADTLCMARAIHGVDAGGSLAKLADRYQIGEKGTEVVAAIGKRREDFTQEELDRYGAYCCNDVELTYTLYNLLGKGFPHIELGLIDQTLRMFIRPELYVDEQILLERKLDIVKERKEILSGLREKLSCETDDEVAKKLSSNKQFAELLVAFGINVPTKTSPTTGKKATALAKKDEGFLALCEHEDVFIQNLCAARLGVKSTLEEKRIQRFIDIGQRNKERIPIPLKYYGAHTGRWAGSDKVNFQNLPSRDVKKKALKNAVIAPPHHLVVNCDSAQIEARVLAWLAGQDDVVKMFAEKQDVYRQMSSKIYSCKPEDVTKEQRFVGKTVVLGCIAEGTPVLCDSGWKPIEQVTVKDQLWDGEGWVCHQGLQNSGIKETLNLCGVWLTPDHKVWSGTQWLEAQSVVADADTLSLVLDTAAVNLPSQVTYRASGEALPHWSYSAAATTKSTQLTSTTSKLSNLHDVICALKKPLVKLINCIGGIATFSQMTRIGKDYLTAFQVVLQDATPQAARCIRIMAAGGLPFTMLGGVTEKNSYATSLHSTGGMTQSSKLTVSTIAKGINRTICGSLVEASTVTIDAPSLSLRRKLQTYDLAYSGPRNRYTVLTARGPIIIHNCGYGTGGIKLQSTLATATPPMVLDEEESKRIVDVYRNTNYKIKGLWGDGDDLLEALIQKQFNGKEVQFGAHGCVWYGDEGIRLPNGLHIRYPDLEKKSELDERTKRTSNKCVYKSRKGPVYIWGGTVVENVVQALARCIVGEQLMEISKHYKVALTVHDSVVCVVPEAEIDEAVAAITGIMSTAPSWATGLPVACEATYGQSYGDC